jgi:hypothetical protein
MWLDGAPLKLGQIETGHVNSPKKEFESHRQPRRNPKIRL